jgi:pimeloyl-ACP methyl ester carboxylesterase
MGLYDNPLDLYGRLLHERFIAQRLVVDTGLNAFGWGLERARAYMRAQTIESDAQIATETLRYATDLPGQALAYHYGFRRFRELRFSAEQAMGEGFDLRALHETILSAGALPLEVLDRHVDQAYARAPTDTAIEVTRGQRRIHVEVEGDPGSTPVILAIHGGPGFSLDYFRPGLSPLRDQGYAIVYLDLPGGGRSSRHQSGESGFEPYLADIEAVRSAIGASRLTLLGHAFGAVLAVEYALSHPVEGLILVNPLRVFRGNGQDAEAQARRVEATDPGLYLDYVDRLAPKIERARAGETALWDEIDGDDWWARMLDTQLALPPSEAWKRTSRSIDWGIAAYSDFKGASFVDPSHPLNAYDLTRRAPGLKVPVLVTLSDNDANYVAMGRTHGEPVANAIAGALTVRLDDLGHFPFAEAPDAFAEAVAPFLRAILARPEPENA